MNLQLPLLTHTRLIPLPLSGRADVGFEAGEDAEILGAGEGKRVLEPNLALEVEVAVRSAAPAHP
jgi:hypothetical protein